MTCWNGHMPHMNTDQMRQAVEAYIRAYERSVAQQWGASPFVGDLPWHAPVTSEPPPKSKRRQDTQRHTDLLEARPQDKVGAIDVEFVRVR